MLGEIKMRMQEAGVTGDLEVDIEPNSPAPDLPALKVTTPAADSGTEVEVSARTQGGRDTPRGLSTPKARSNNNTIEAPAHQPTSQNLSNSKARGRYQLAYVAAAELQADSTLSLRFTAKQMVDLQTQLKKSIESDGFVIVRGLIPPEVITGCTDTCARIVEEIAERLHENGSIVDKKSDLSFEKRLSGLLEQCPEVLSHIKKEMLHNQGMGDLFFNSELLQMVEYALGTSEIRLYPNYAGEFTFVCKHCATHTHTH
jgi:hypothetical protein